MKWNFQIVKAQHYREIGNIPGVEQSGKQLCYLDKVSDTLVPMLDGPLSPKDILAMEEWTQEDEGFIFMDCEKHKVGLIVRGE